MKENVYRKIDLENNHTLTILDLSRKIGADAWVVRMKAVVEVGIAKDLFKKPLPPEVSFEQIKEVLGDKVAYEYMVERNFIMDHEKEGLFETLLQTFLNNLGQYVSKKSFPEKFVLKAYKDKVD